MSQQDPLKQSILASIPPSAFDGPADNNSRWLDEFTQIAHPDEIGQHILPTLPATNSEDTTDLRDREGKTTIRFKAVEPQPNRKIRRAQHHLAERMNKQLVNLATRFFTNPDKSTPPRTILTRLNLEWGKWVADRSKDFAKAGMNPHDYVDALNRQVMDTISRMAQAAPLESGE